MSWQKMVQERRLQTQCGHVTVLTAQGGLFSAPADTVLSPGTPVDVCSSCSAPAHGGRASQGKSGLTEGQILAVSEFPH